MEETRVRLRGIQRKVAQHMVQSKNEIPHVTTIREVRMDKIGELRSQYNQEHPDQHISFMPYIIAATISAIRAQPVFNARLDGEEIVFCTPINMGIAVTVGENLVVPVIHGASEMNFAQLCAAFHDLTVRAKDGLLKSSDFKDGTFTISNSGALGGEIFTPIINHPQSAILGIGRIRQKPIVEETGTIIACPMMYLCLSYDHRIINGSQAVGLLSAIDAFLQTPTL